MTKPRPLPQKMKQVPELGKAICEIQKAFDEVEGKIEFPCQIDVDKYEEIRYKLYKSRCFERTATAKQTKK